METYDEFNDPELRYRQRYVDLVVNPKVKTPLLNEPKSPIAFANFTIKKGI